jgi:arylsulfatase A-like enzyme
MHDPTTEFKGHIGDTYRDSTPWWPQPQVAPEGAPNVLFVVLDDVGFADLGCYGSEIRTPYIDALAADGLRYSNFHVTAMCSPTRASLLTGRNAHAVGVGAIAEWSNGFPGYQGRISPSAATVAELLGENGYGAYAVGKWHLSNLANYGTAGPHGHWPLGRGFSRWYGFLGGYVDHWNPDLHEDNHPVRHTPRPGYHLTEDLVDHAIAQIRDHVTSAPARPWMQYLALGAGHWPLHVPAANMAKYRGRYDAGWDAIREERHQRQLALGIVPPGTALAPRNPGVPLWDDMDADARTVCARLQEAYAGFMDHADEQLGRLVAHLRETGQLDNTLIVLLSDNGASGEGGPTGAINIRKHLQTERETVQYVLERLDLIGGEFSFPHYPMGWAQVSNTPLKWYKKNTHGGGIRAPLIVHWPRGIAPDGVVRPQYHHVSDIVPTVLELIGASAPSVYKGVPQVPLHGISMAYSFADATVPTRKRIQHFEIVGDRALWQDGWKVVARHAKGEDFSQDRWELYHLESDFSETQDLAAQHPERVEQMVALWWEEARRYSVLPLDDRESERAFDFFRNGLPLRYELQPGMARFDRLLVPSINDRHFRIEARLDSGPQRQAQGIVLSCGNRFGGYVLYCQGGEVVFEYVYSDSVTHRLSAPMPSGVFAVSVACERLEGKAARFSLRIDGALWQTFSVPNTWTTYGITAGFTCGYGNAPVSEACLPPGDFQGGTIERVVVELVERGAEPAAPDFAAILQEE